MKALLPFLACAVLFASGSSLSADDDLDSQILQLEKTGQDFAGAAALTGSMANASPDLKMMADEYRNFSSNFGSVQSSIQNNDYDQAVRMLRRWLARTKNEQIKKSLTSLLEAIQKQRKKQIDDLTKLLDEKLAATSSALAKATTPEDVEVLRYDLEDFRNEECNGGGREIQRMANRISRATSFLEGWRQFIAAQSEGDYQQALSYLTSLRRNGGNAGLVSSKEMAARYTAILEKQLSSLTNPDEASPVTKAIAGIMDTVKSGKDASAAATRLALIQSFASGTDSRYSGILQSQLDQIGRMQRDLDEGAYGRVLGNSDFSSSQATPYDAKCAALRAEIKGKAIIGAYNLENLGSPKPGESFSAFLRDAANQAFEKKDWKRLVAVSSAFAAASGGSYYGQQENPQQGAKAYLAGEQLEKAGLYRDAVHHYTNCIALTGAYVPREEAAAAIERLRKDQPQAFAPEGK